MTESSDWRIEFARAMAISTAAVIALTGFLSAAGLPQANRIRPRERCSVTSCMVAPDGGDILLTYWQSDPNGKSLHRGLARLDLRNSSRGLQPVSTHKQPWRLARLGASTCYLAEAAGRITLQPLDTDDSGPRAAISLPGNCTAELATSPDGKTLVAATSDKLQVIDVECGKVRWERAADVECFALHDRCGLFVALGKGIFELSLENGAILRTITPSAEHVRLLTIDRAGNSLAWLDWNGTIEVIRLRDGASVWRQHNHGSQSLPPTYRPALFGRALAFSSDGRYLVTAASEGEWVLAIWNTRTGVRVRTLRGHDDTINGAAFLADGSLASWGADGTLRLWNVQRSVVRRVFHALELPLLAGSRDASAA